MNRFTSTLLLICFLLAVCLPLAGLPASQEVPSLLEEPESLEIPFSAGEELGFEVHWKPLFFFPSLKAGEIHLEIEESSFDSTDTFKIRAWARSGGTLSRVVGLKVENYYESEVDQESFRSYRNLQRTRQGSRQRDLELVFDYQKRHTVVYEIDPSEEPPEVIRDESIRGISGPVIDVLSVFYAGRLRNMEPGDVFKFHLNEKGEFKEVRVMALEEEQVETPVGSFPAIKLSTQGGLFKSGGDFRIWYSRDPLRVPVKFEADVNFGKIYGSLLRLETPRVSHGIIRTK